jgi:hypothetical protein
MRVFYQAFPIRDALRPELSWTHYRTLLRVESEPAGQWYMREAASQGWTTRALERQISTLYYERLLSSSDRSAVEKEPGDSVQSLQTPRDFKINGSETANRRALRVGPLRRPHSFG